MREENKSRQGRYPFDNVLRDPEEEERQQQRQQKWQLESPQESSQGTECKDPEVPEAETEPTVAPATGIAALQQEALAAKETATVTEEVTVMEGEEASPSTSMASPTQPRSPSPPPPPPIPHAPKSYAAAIAMAIKEKYKNRGTTSEEKWRGGSSSGGGK